MRGTLSEHRAKPCRLTPDDSDLTFSDPSATGTSVLLIALNKPFQVLSQFTDRAGRPTLAAYLSVPGVHAAGRLGRRYGRGWYRYDDKGKRVG